jgi:hypothetical protein
LTQVFASGFEGRIDTTVAVLDKASIVILEAKDRAFQQGLITGVCVGLSSGIILGLLGTFTVMSLRKKKKKPGYSANGGNPLHLRETGALV